MGSQVWLLLLRGGRLDTSKHGQFTVNASLRWPMPTSDRQGRFWFGWFRGVSCRTPSEPSETSAPAASQSNSTWGLLLSSSCNVPLIVPRPRNTHRRVAGATRQTASAKSDAPVPSILVVNGAIKRLRLSTQATLLISFPFFCRRAEVPHQAFASRSATSGLRSSDDVAGPVQRACCGGPVASTRIFELDYVLPDVCTSAGRRRVQTASTKSSVLFSADAPITVST